MVLAGADAGAVYKPDEETIPTVEFPPEKPLTSQLTEVFVVPETEALNCCDCPTCKRSLVGEIETVTGACVMFVIVTLALAETYVYAEH